ncbi:helix-turn-helix domain-containing protein [Catalinimonas sp. 4WD22]|uniref:helix-turn-helix domain-containing protein n=1 Tax=Catalinimonas locisalis TaxID=3133978 RepID=UPI00310144C7
MDIIFTAGLIGTTIGFLAAYLLLLKVIRRANALNVMLFLLVFSLTWTLLITFLNESGLIIHFPHIFRTGIPSGFLFGPATYLYIRAYPNNEKRNSFYDYLHFLPSVLVLADLIPFHIKPTAEKKEIIQNYINNSNAYLNWNEGTLIFEGLTWFVCLYILVYVGFSVKKIYARYKINQTAQRKNFSGAEFKWLLSLVTSVSVIALMFLWSVITKSEYHFAYTTFAIVSGFICMAFTFMLFHSPHILYGEVKIMSATKKYTPFDETQLESYVEKVKQFVHESKCFLKISYSLEDLAKDTEIDRRQLSMIINQGIGMKYNEMINRFRLEYLMQHYREVNHKNLTIEGIASEVGFNSRTTFFHSVKKFTGLTPTEFVKRLENNGKLEMQSNNDIGLFKA